MELQAALPWHRDNWRRLQAARDSQRLPHALLLRGPAGVGKQYFAERLAASLLCLSPGVDGEPCGACRGCHLYRVDTHPDLIRLAPAESGKPITVDSIRDYCFGNVSKPQLGGFQVMLMFAAEQMNTAAANAFLKTLEEPASDSLLILYASRPERLPATIRSRCQAVDFATPDPATPAGQGARAWLDTRTGTPERLDTALAISAGAPFTARALLDEEGRLDERDRALQAYLKLLGQRADPIALAADWQQLDSDWLSRWWNGWLLDLSILGTATRAPRLFNPDFRADLQAVAQTLDLAKLHRLLQQVLKLRGELQQQLNKQLLLERLLIESTNLKRV